MWASSAKKIAQSLAKFEFLATQTGVQTLPTMNYFNEKTKNFDSIG